MPKPRQADESWIFLTLLPQRLPFLKKELQSWGLDFEVWHDQIVAIRQWPLKAQKPAWAWHRAQKAHILSWAGLSSVIHPLQQAGHRFLYLPHPDTHWEAWPWVRDLPWLAKRVWNPLKPLPHFYPVSLVTLLPDGNWLVLENLYPPWHWGIYWMKWPQAPSRAYLKLLEAWLWVTHPPKANSRVIEAGSAPGGWTYALKRLYPKIELECWDKAQMDPSVLKLPKVQHIARDFYKAIEQGHHFEWQQIDWFFSDMALSPDKIANVVETVVNQNPNLQMIVTIKLIIQKPEQFESIKRLWHLPGAFLHHLYHNKHEVTFFKLHQPRW